MESIVAESKLFGSNTSRLYKEIYFYRVAFASTLKCTEFLRIFKTFHATSCKARFLSIFYAVHHLLNRAVSTRGAGTWPPPRVLADQLTLSQPKGSLCPPHYYVTPLPRIFRSCDGPALLLKSRFLYLKCACYVMRTK